MERIAMIVKVFPRSLIAELGEYIPTRSVDSLSEKASGRDSLAHDLPTSD